MGRACQRRRAAAVARRPSTQATTRRLARSTASQLLALRFFRPQTRQGRARLLRFFLPAWPPSCGPRRSRAQCYVASCVPPTAFPPGRSAPPARRRPAQTGPGSRRLCIGSARARCYARCAESARCRSERKYVGSVTISTARSSCYFRPPPNFTYRTAFRNSRNSSAKRRDVL